MTLIDDIARMEAAAKSHRVDDILLRQELGTLRKRPKEPQVVEGVITLDTRKDPDPHGLHGFSLEYRLRCMGWP